MERIKNNFHLCITLSPTGDEFKDHLVRLKRGLLKEMTVVWVQEQAKEALTELAYKHFINIYIEEEKVRIKEMKTFEMKKGLKKGETGAKEGLIEGSFDEVGTKVKTAAMKRLHEAPPN